MTALQGRIAEHKRKLADGALYGRDKQAFEAAAAELGAAESALEAAEDQWLELELAREASESA